MWILGIAILVILAGLILVIAKKQQITTSTASQANRDIYQSRLQELEASHDEGTLTDREYAQAQLELKKSLVTDLHNPDEQVQFKAASVVWVFLVALVIAGGSYFANSSWKQQHQADRAFKELPERSQRLLQDASATVEADDLELFALGLRQKLAKEPDAMAWSLYGRLMMEMRQLDEALASFGKSHDINPDSVSNLLAYAEARLYSGSDEDLTQAARLIRRVLELEPTHVTAVIMLGVIAYEKADYDKAVQAWAISLRLLDEQDPRYAAIEQSMQDAQDRLDGTVTTVTVTVTISDALQNELPMSATLFVFIRDPDGNSAPIAAKRMQVSEFPMTLTLTDQDAMLGDRRLIDVPNWLVGALLTQGGLADPQSGDMEARPVLIESNSQAKVTVHLSHIRP